MRFDGLIERARGHLYVQLRNQEPGHLRDYKIETSTLENFKRIHNLLRAISKLVLRQAQPSTPAPPANPTKEANVSATRNVRPGVEHGRGDVS
jgi:hypothetical protein